MRGSGQIPHSRAATCSMVNSRITVACTVHSLPTVMARWAFSGDTLPSVVTLAHLSDIHMGAADPEVLDHIVGDVSDQRPDAVIVTGDLTMRARSHEFAAARAFLDRLPRPQLIVLGNHDVPLYQLAERMTEPYGRFVRGAADHLDPELDVEGATILGLQSMPRWRWKSGRVSHRQTRLVRDVLGTAPSEDLRVLALHHPPSATGLETVWRAEGLRRAMADARVDLVLAGHTHVPTVTEFPVHHGPRLARIVEVVCGTSTSTRTRGAPVSWMLIRADAQEITVTARVVSDDGWYDGGTAQFTRQSHPTDEGPAAS